MGNRSSLPIDDNVEEKQADTTEDQKRNDETKQSFDAQILSLFVQELCKLSKNYNYRLDSYSLDHTASNIILQQPTDQSQIKAIQAFGETDVGLLGVLERTNYDTVADYLLVHSRHKLANIPHGSESTIVQSRIDRYFELQGQSEAHEASKQRNLRAHQWIMDQRQKDDWQL